MIKEITSHSNETVKMLRSLKHKKYRDQEGLYLVEGARIVEEAINYGAQIECFITSDDKNALMPLIKDRELKVLLMPYAILEQIGDTKTPPKEMVLIKKEQPKEDTQKRPEGNFFVALDDVNDPKNVGSIIRTADAMGADAIFISENSADYFGPKAQRAAMGSSFHLPIVVGDLPSLLAMLKKEQSKIIAATLRGDTELKESYNKLCLVIGNEARGVSKTVVDLADRELAIKLSPRADSLNAGVAAGILLYEARKRVKG